MATVRIHYVTFTIKGTPVIEKYSTKELAERRVAEVQATLKVPVKML